VRTPATEDPKVAEAEMLLPRPFIAEPENVIGKAPARGAASKARAPPIAANDNNRKFIAV